MNGDSCLFPFHAIKLYNFVFIWFYEITSVTSFYKRLTKLYSLIA